MALTAQEIEDGRSDFTNNSKACPAGCDKPACSAAFAYTGAFLKSKTAEWVAGLPEPFKTQSTPAQKALLFLHAAAILASRRI